MGKKYAIVCIRNRVDDAIYRLLQQKWYGDCTFLNLKVHTYDDVMIDLFRFMILTWKFNLPQSSSMQDELVLKHMQTFKNRSFRFSDSHIQSVGRPADDGPSQNPGQPAGYGPNPWRNVSQPAGYGPNPWRVGQTVGSGPNPWTMAGPPENVSHWTGGRALELGQLMTKLIQAGCLETACSISEQMLEGLYMD